MTLSSNSTGLTPAKEKILQQAMYHLHLGTLEQIGRYMDYKQGAYNGLGRHLLKMTTEGYLDRFPLPTGFALQPYVYMLGTRGSKYFTEELHWDVPKLPSLAT